MKLKRKLKRKHQNTPLHLAESRLTYLIELLILQNLLIKLKNQLRITRLNVSMSKSKKKKHFHNKKYKNNRKYRK